MLSENTLKELSNDTLKQIIFDFQQEIDTLKTALDKVVQENTELENELTLAKKDRERLQQIIDEMDV